MQLKIHQLWAGKMTAFISFLKTFIFFYVCNIWFIIQKKAENIWKKYVTYPGGGGGQNNFVLAYYMGSGKKLDQSLLRNS